VGEKDLITEEYCNKSHKVLTDKISFIDHILNGNGNLEEGLRYKTQILWVDYQLRKKTTMGWIDWAYRAVLGVIVSYIALRLGLK
jgi:hypothetical protein